MFLMFAIMMHGLTLAASIDNKIQQFLSPIFIRLNNSAQPNDGSISSDFGDDTEIMMDELLMTPPISGAVMRGLLPRRTLEPLIEEGSETSSSSSIDPPTEPSVSPEQVGTNNRINQTHLKIFIKIGELYPQRMQYFHKESVALVLRNFFLFQKYSISLFDITVK